MKTIRGIIEKWDEMYNLVMVGTADSSNNSWRNLQDVFMLPDAAMDEAKEKVRELCDEWSNLTEDDIMQDEKDWPLVMKFIGDMLSMSTSSRYPFYIYNGEVGILAYVDDDIIKGHGLTEYGGIAFVPCYDLGIIPDKDCGACVTYDDCYGEYSNCVEIDNHTIVNVENEQKLLYDEWVSDMYAESDEYVRELLELTGNYDAWTSDRTRAIEAIEHDISVFDEFLDEEDTDEAGKFCEMLLIHQESWNNTCNNYCDPLGFAYFKDKTVDFLSILDDVYMSDYLSEYTFKAFEEFKNRLKSEKKS